MGVLVETLSRYYADLVSLNLRPLLAIVSAIGFVLLIPIGVAMQWGEAPAIVALGSTLGVASYFLGATE